MFWTAWKLGSSMWDNSVALQETAFAAAGVIRHRVGIIDSALRDPLAADLPELNRMIPEKVAAFTQAGSAIAGDLIEFQSEMLAQGRDFATLFVGWPHSTAALERMGKRSARMLLSMSMAGGRAIKPVHDAATGNHRRLKKSGRRSPA